MATFKNDDLVPFYINNARIETTSDNVFIDFGFADPFDAKSEHFESKILSRIIMNHSTFKTFLAHLNGIETSVKAETLAKSAAPAEGVDSRVLSRCPPRIEER